jgi:hypothetical protein
MLCFDAYISVPLNQPINQLIINLSSYVDVDKKSETEFLQVGFSQQLLHAYKISYPQQSDFKPGYETTHPGKKCISEKKHLWDTYSLSRRKIRDKKKNGIHLCAGTDGFRVRT